MNIRKPVHKNVNQELQWLGSSLGLFNPRDKDKSCYRVFLTLIKDLKNHGSGLSSDELAILTGLTRGTAVHHLNRLMEAGIVSNHRGKYSLRVETLEELVEDIRTQINKTFDGVKEVAKYLDQHLEL